MASLILGLLSAIENGGHFVLRRSYYERQFRHAPLSAVGAVAVGGIFPMIGRMYREGQQ